MLLESFVGAFLVPWHDSRCLNSRPNQPQEDMRCHQHLITNDVVRYMAEYEVCVKGRAFTRVSNKRPNLLLQASGDPDVIGRLVLLLAEWYFAWAPGGEYVSPSLCAHCYPLPSDEIPVRLG